MARLLTSVSTPSGSESCSDRSSGLSSEAPLGEGLTEGRGGSLKRDISFQTSVTCAGWGPSQGRPLPFASDRLPRLPGHRGLTLFATICELQHQHQAVKPAALDAPPNQEPMTLRGPRCSHEQVRV